MAGERDAKRQKIEPQEFTVGTDLEVEVEDEMFHVHSVILMLVSPVFRQMLSHNMKEAATRHIDLKDKKKDEFKVFLEVIQPLSLGTFTFTNENAPFLARWADEYQVQSLKEQCEGFLVKSSPITIAALVHAVECNLPKRLAQCMESVSSRLGDFLLELKTCELPASVVEMLWPCLCKAADLEEVNKDMPDVEHIRSMWPFVLQAISKEKARKEQEAKLVAFSEPLAKLRLRSPNWNFATGFNYQKLEMFDIVKSFPNN